MAAARSHHNRGACCIPRRRLACPPVGAPGKISSSADRVRTITRRGHCRQRRGGPRRRTDLQRDRKSTRLNSSHLGISYAVFCLKKKKDTKELLLPETTSLYVTSRHTLL